jgi:hypothetical protein
MVQNALGPLVNLMQSAGPIFQGMSVMLAEIGTGLGKMFDLIAQHGTAGGQVFAALGAIIQQLLPIIGQLASVGVELAAQVLPGVASALGLVANVLDKIAPVLPEILAGFLAFKAVSLLNGPITSFAGVLGKLGDQDIPLASRAASGLSSGLDVFGKALPAVGLAVGVFGAALSNNQSRLDGFAQGLLQGGTAAEQARAEMEKAPSCLGPVLILGRTRRRQHGCGRQAAAGSDPARRRAHRGHVAAAAEAAGRHAGDERPAGRSGGPESHGGAGGVPVRRAGGKQSALAASRRRWRRRPAARPWRCS